MPLITSPIDGSPMRQIVRNGIEIDVCPTTGGIWLDKGELEKLLALLGEAVNESDADFEAFKQAKRQNNIQPVEYQYASPPQYRQHHHRRDDDDYEDYHKYKYGKRSKLKSLFDFFD
jgi:uncharacterized protein